MRNAFCFFAAGVAFFVLNPNSARAQTVITAGIQEIYDNNIFLENSNGTPPPVVVDEQLSNPTLNIIPPKQVNGDPDHDYITNPFVAFSGPISLTQQLKTAYEGKIGALLFADNSDESRMTADLVFTGDTEKSLLPDPYYAGTKLALQSRVSDVTAAQGTASKQAETFLGDIHLGVRDIKLATDTKFGAGYLFTYNDFLGDWSFGNRSEDLGQFNNRVEAQGSDYFTNGIDTTLTQTLTPSWEAGLFAGITDYVFTNVETNSTVNQTSSDLDRTEGLFGGRTSYQISQQVSIGGSAGVSLSHLKDKPADVFFTVIQPDGTPTQVQKPGDQDQESFVFAGNLNYAPDSASLLRLAVDQSQQTDVDGDRLITRSVTMDASKGIGDRLKLAAGGRYLEYNIGDSLTNPSKRWEVTLSAQYSLTEAIALTAGWNYVNQNADDSNLQQQLLFSSEDYEGQRFFIGLTGGLVGTKS